MEYGGREAETSEIVIYFYSCMCFGVKVKGMKWCTFPCVCVCVCVCKKKKSHHGTHGKFQRTHALVSCMKLWVIMFALLLLWDVCPSRGRNCGVSKQKIIALFQCGQD